MSEPEPQAKKSASAPRLVAGLDYYLNDAGLMVFTEAYHLQRGHCCESGCRHCPYDFNKKKGSP